MSRAQLILVDASSFSFCRNSVSKLHLLSAECNLFCFCLIPLLAGSLELHVLRVS